MYQQLRVWGWIAVAVVAGCGDDGKPAETGDMSPPPPPEVVVRTDAASVADCPYGGSIVSSGIDANGNHVLDDSEISARTALCSDMPVPAPPQTVFRLVAAQSTASCPPGGTAVQSGADRNGNGQLDDEEVEHTDVVCGAVLLTRFMAEPPGDHCIGGGIAFQVGRDRDGDGALSDGEVEHTDFTCGDIVARSIQVRTADDVAALAHIHVISGALTVADPLEELDLPELQYVSSFLSVANTKRLTRVSLPALRSVDFALTIQSNAALTSADLHVVSSITGDLTIFDNPVLVDGSAIAPNATVAGDVVIQQNPALTAARVPPFVTGDITVLDDPALTSLVASTIDRVNRVTVARTGLQKLLLGGGTIRAVENALAEVSIFDNPALEEIDISTDRIGPLSVWDNDSLKNVFVSADHWDGSVSLDNAHMDVVDLGGPLLGEPANIAGSLTIQGPVGGLALLSGINVGGDFTLEGSEIERLMNFGTVGGNVRIAHNPELKGGDSGLRFGGSFTLIDNATLESGLFFTQDAINGDVVISDNPMLRNAQSLNGGVVHGSVTISNNRSMIETVAGATVIEGDLTISDNASLTSAGFFGLQSARTVRIVNNAALPVLSLPALSLVSEVRVDGNAALNHVELPALARAPSLRIDHNHALPSCEILALYARIAGGPFEQSDNDDAASCAAMLAPGASR